MRVINFTSVKALPFIICVAILGWCFFVTGCNVENGDDESDPIIVVSNVFTPDSEAGNAFFEVTSKNTGDVVSLKIYTRAGVLVFSDEAERCIWWGYSLDGQPMASGVYHYTAEIRTSSPKISKSGFVHLYR